MEKVQYQLGINFKAADCARGPVLQLAILTALQKRPCVERFAKLDIDAFAANGGLVPQSVSSCPVQRRSAVLSIIS